MKIDEYLRLLTAQTRTGFEAKYAELKEHRERDKKEYEMELRYEAASIIDIEAEEEEIIFQLEKSVSRGWWA